MSFHSQNSSIGYWNISNGCNITIAVLNGISIDPLKYILFYKKELAICIYFLYLQGYI